MVVNGAKNCFVIRQFERIPEYIVLALIGLGEGMGLQPLIISELAIICKV